MESTKEGSWDSYGKVFTLGHRYNRDLFKGFIEIEEKVDGSQFSFGKFGGELMCRTRNTQFNPLECTQGMFALACETVIRLGPKLTDGWTYRGEVLAKPKHNVLCYDRVPTHNIILWDIATDKQDYLDSRAKRVEAQLLGLECVRILWSGQGGVTNIDHLIYALSDTMSSLGGCKIEGFVIKNNNQFGADGKRMTGKWVSDEFKEVHRKKSYGKVAKKDISTAIGERYCSEARWEKSIQRLLESGEELELRHIGPLLGSIQQDVHAECQDEIKNELFGAFWKDIARATTAGFVPWYKAKLLDIEKDRLAEIALDDEEFEESFLGEDL